MQLKAASLSNKYKPRKLDRPTNHAGDTTCDYIAKIREIHPKFHLGRFILSVEKQTRIS